MEEDAPVAPGGEGSEATRLLRAACAGDAAAAEQLLPLIYDQLRALASSYMRREPSAHTLQPTALVHEAFLKLVGGGELKPRDCAHFFALSARAMRQILVDHARGKRASKRGGELQRVTLEDSLVLGEAGRCAQVEILDLDRALEQLGELHARQCRVVELRYFAGLTIAEAATALGVSSDTVEDDWTMAKAWLRRRLRAA